MAVTEWDDIQALVKTGFGSLPEAGYLLLRVREAAAAKAWLRAVRVTCVADGVVAEAVQVALTAPGLAALGVERQVIAGFDPEFRAGMSADPSRSRRLGDTGANAPAGWSFGHGDAEPHVLVMLYAAAGALAGLRARIEGEAAAGFDSLAWLDTGRMGGREPFGFLDGVSQPVIDWDGAHTPGKPGGYTHVLAAGEVLLGYPNEYDRLTDRPLLDPAVAPELPREAGGRADLGRNGSYLVLRRLAQDVRGFWQWTAAAGDGLAGGVALAEAMVGRSLTGQRPAGLVTRTIGGAQAYDLNNYSYVDDPSGLLCPVGAHVRRANPRNADLPSQPDGLINKLSVTLGWTGAAKDDAVSSVRFHRILRRGREYGAFVEPADAAKPDAPEGRAGLNFICLQASISRQFEFVQGAWAHSARFAGLSGESDPLLGNREPFAGETNGFVRPGIDGVAERHTLPRFVTVGGGAYFWLPGVKALTFVAG